MSVPARMLSIKRKVGRQVFLDNRKYERKTIAGIIVSIPGRTLSTKIARQVLLENKKYERMMSAGIIVNN